MAGILVRWRWWWLALPVAVLLVAVLAPVHPASAALSLGGPVELGYCGGDDWEPTVAADHAGHIYVLITHYRGDTSCDPASGLNHARIMIQVSSDDGKTFSVPRVVADMPGGIAYPSQADPAIAVDPASGDVYVSFLAYGLSGGHTDVYVAKSADFGASFTAVQVNSHDCKNCDHPKLLVSGNDVYVAYSQATNHFISVSTDAGARYTEPTSCGRAWWGSPRAGSWMPGATPGSRGLIARRVRARACLPPTTGSRRPWQAPLPPSSPTSRPVTRDLTAPSPLAIHVICDNLAAHKAPVVHKWLLAHPRVQLHFTPTYSSWISQAERWFAELQRRCPDRGVFCSLDELTTALEERIKIWNASARPFKGTKTADQIIDRICRYCSRISGPAH